MSDPFMSAYNAVPIELGSDPALELAKRFAYVMPEAALIDVVARYAPIVEIGAGTGYWTYMLRQAGVDTVAYDHAPLGGARENRYHPDVKGWADVLIGDASALAVHPDRALFLCWPPVFSELGDVLSAYIGDVVIYVGDRGHRTAWPQGLDIAYEMVEVHPVLAMDPMPGSQPELSVWRRACLSRDCPR